MDGSLEARFTNDYIGYLAETVYLIDDLRKNASYDIHEQRIVDFTGTESVKL